jgi:hemoglobin
MDTHPTPDTPPYELLGGEAAVRRLVNRFYDLMDETPELYVIRKLHSQDLAGSREKLFMFLSGWLGGPQLYVERHGHPRLRARHLPFSIGVAERDAWIACMKQAMADCEIEEGMREWLLNSLFGTADWMRNRPDEPGGSPAVDEQRET